MGKKLFLAKLVHDIRSYRVLSILMLSQIIITVLASVSGVMFLYSYMANKNEADFEKINLLFLVLFLRYKKNYVHGSSFKPMNL